MLKCTRNSEPQHQTPLRSSPAHQRMPAPMTRDTLRPVIRHTWRGGHPFDTQARRPAGGRGCVHTISLARKDPLPTLSVRRKPFRTHPPNVRAEARRELLSPFATSHRRVHSRPSRSPYGALVRPEALPLRRHLFSCVQPSASKPRTVLTAARACWPCWSAPAARRGSEQPTWCPFGGRRTDLFFLRGVFLVLPFLCASKRLSPLAPVRAVNDNCDRLPWWTRMRDVDMRVIILQRGQYE